MWDCWEGVWLLGLLMLISLTLRESTISMDLYKPHGCIVSISISSQLVETREMEGEPIAEGGVAWGSVGWHGERTIANP